MGTHSIAITVVVLLLLTSHLSPIAAGRQKRQILGNQPKIITQDGHLVFQSGANHNITFQPGAGGAVFVNTMDLTSAMMQVQTTKSTVDRLSASFGAGSNNLTLRVTNLESQLSQMNSGGSNNQALAMSQQVMSRQQILRLRINGLEQRMPDGTSITVTNSRVANVTARVQALEAANNNNSGGRASSNRRRSRTSRRIRSLRRRVRRLETTVSNLQTLLTTNECASNPCMHGGTCVDMYNGYMCRCPRNWQGPRCTQDVNECNVYQGTDLGCQNGGHCHNTNGGYWCECTNNFHGINCRETHNDCTGASQHELCGHGTCVNVDRVQAGQAHYRCICDEGWTSNGTHPGCVIDVDECSGTRHCSVDPPVPCFNIPGSYICGSCPSGYEGNGFTCSDVNECSTNNGGCSQNPYVHCTNSRGSSACGPCPAGYEGNGRICNFVGTCATNNGGCHSLAQCQENTSGGLAICTCPTGYVGTGRGPNGCVAQGQAGGCSSNPCVNGGACLPLFNNGFTCSCPPGYTGTTCSVPTNACSSNPCRNGGTCTSGSNGTFSCTCTGNYTGATCQTFQQTTCGGYFTTESGALDYPPGSWTNYDHHQSCAWVITTSVDKIIRLNFTHMNIEPHPSCAYDSLQIYDGNSASANRIGIYCGSSLPTGIESTGNHLYLWFQSDHSQRATGFELTWSSHLAGCGGHLSGSDQGFIVSPGHPNHYPPNVVCAWTVEVSAGNNILITFHHLAIEQHHSCRYDHLEVRDGETNTSPLIERFCTSQTPDPITTTGPYAYVEFKSDGSVSDTGFNISYQATPSTCGASLTDRQGTIQSPNYPNAYNQDGQCVWTITTASYTNVQLTFSAFNLQSSSGCAQNSLTIRDGSDQTANQLAQLCNDDSPASITSSGNTLFLELRSDTTMSGSGFQAQWTTACGGIFNGMTGQIASPGWPSAYQYASNCIYQISVPELHTVKLNITDFFDHADECPWDYVKVYDGADVSSSLINPVLCGPLTTNIFRSTGSSMTVRFHTDSSINYMRFRATYTAEASSGDPQCGENINGVTGHVIRSSNTDTPPGTPCEWIITVPPGNVVRLTFFSFRIPYASDGSCGQNVGLTVEDMVPQGQSLNRSSLGTFCGNRLATSFISTDNEIAFRMIAQNNSVDQFFFVVYQALNASYECGGELTDAYGVLESPNYPQDYPHNILCVWTITVPQGHQIRLNFTDFQIEPHSSCRYDYLEIRNGGFSTSPVLRTYCGTTTLASPVISHSNRLYIKFVTDSSVAARGFSITYGSGATGCGGELTTPTGGFISPNYPNEYDHNVECIWSIRVSRGSSITLSFDDFDLEHAYDCGYDFLQVNERSQNGRMLGKYCGSTIPAPIFTSENKMWIQYKTDGSVPARGFSASYIMNCNNNITGRSGVIESPNYPMPHPHYSDCTWIITVPPGNRVNVSFVSFHLEYNSNNCRFDKLEVRDGSSSTDTLLHTLCGNALPDPIRSSGNSLWLHFSSDYSIAHDGFRLEWVQDGCGGFLTGTSGTFTTPNYPNDYPHNVECGWSIQVPFGQRVQLLITDFEVEFVGTCEYDAFVVHAGSDDTGPQITKFCHNQLPQSNQVITAPGNMMFVSFKTDGSVAEKGFSINWSAVAGGCGGNFSVSSASFTSPNFPQNYDNNLDCEWLIQVAEAHTVELTFYTFNLEFHHDRITLYDGPNNTSPQIGQFSGSRLTIPASYRSNSNIMLVRFRSDSSYTVQGFNATYRTACGGTLNADIDGAIEAPHTTTLLSECVWHINSQINTRRVSLTFTSFDMRGDCDRNYVSVADTLGPSTGDDREVQQTYCGSSLPPMYTSRSSVLTVVMNASNIFNAQFRAVYTSAADACGGTFNAFAGRFNSPGYPDPYPGNTECVWQITTAPGNSLQLSFNVFSLDPIGGFYDDYVEIYTPDINGQLQGRWFANNMPSNLTNMAGIWIKFRSNDDENTGPGFSAEWTTATSNELTGNIGQIGSPGALYPNNADLRWTILVDPGNRIRITFNSFDMQRNIMGYCYFDFLQIFDGAESDGVSLGRFCGDQLPDPVTSENNQVSLWLHTDYHLNFPGFLLSWQAIPTVPLTTFVPPTSSSGCGGVLFANETAEQLTSPGYPSDHAHYLDCYWTIAAPRGGKVSINFTDFELEYHHVCHFDFVEIRDGGLNGTLIGRYCSRNTPPRIVSETSVISIYFRSDYSIAEKGFALMYQIACGGTQDTSSGVITSPGYPSTYPDGQNCTWRVTVPLDRTILVSFNQPFNILPGPSGDCSNDYLQLYNGIGLAAPPLVVNGSSNTNGRYCGSSPPTGRLETGSNFLTANFISDASSSAAGFSFNYTEQRYGCGGRLYLLNGVTSGYFTSPRYPNPYPQNVDCKWVIIAPATMRVQVDFVQPFYIEDHNNCKYDYISFRDGGTENAPSLGAKSCGTHLPGSVVSSGNVLFARFQTDDSVVRQGFRARYSIASCGGRITAMDTYITSPNFPNNYGPNLNCFWVIQGPVGHYLTLKISPIRLQYSNDCEADVLEVIDPSLAPSNDSLPEQSPAAQGISVIEAAANASGGMLFRDCGRRYSETTVETADNRAYIWFRSDGQNSGSGFKIEFTASVEVCGGTLTLPSGVITSPNYPNSYAHRRRCRWDITVAAGRKITLTFTDFRLESTYRCRGDFVYVKNGLLRRSPRLGRFCGTTPPSPVSSSGNTMRVYFITDRTITHGGFRAEYSSDLDADCGGVLTENTGIITSPNFTTSRGGNYDHSVQCLWQIHNDAQHSTIRMKFTHMDLEYHSNCYYDFVQIREGTSRQGGLVGTFCGNSSTNFRTRRGMWQGFDAISIPTPDAWVAFISDHSISGGGFRMEYRFTDCGGVYNGPSGVITSPNYPNNYNDNDDCAWLIRAPEGMVIKVNVTDFEFERHSNCHYDFMMIQNGGDYDAPKIGSYCHNDTVPPITSQSNELRIVMSTDSSITSRGFRLEYSFSERGCGGHLTSNDGTIQSPNYPSSYPDNSYCMWDIIVENNFFIVLTFTPPFDVACNDFVKVYDIHDNGTADLLGSYCHNTVPPVLKSSFNKMRVVFQSDATTNGNGFSANFSTECGAVIETDRATLVSPGYPGYRENLFCKFVLNPGSGKTLRLNFRDFQLERHSQCNYDYLRIYQGTNTSGIRIANLCGDIRPEQVVARNQMYLEFKTDGSRNNRGYRASYRAEACGGNFTSRDRYISTPAYPHPYPNNANCTWNITVEHNKVIVLKFRHFDVQSSYNCYADYVAIYDGNSRQATSLGRFCGDRNAVPRVIRSSSNSLILNLVSNYYGSGKGFTARYIASYGPSLGCGGNLQEASGAIQSLDIDNDGYHEKSLDCLWTITADPNKVIVVNITNLHLEDGGYGTRRCPYDYVKVYDGTSQSDPLLLHVCGHQSQPVVAVSSSNTLVVHFVSDSVIVRSGFNMTYYQQDAVCGGNLNATSALQNLTSPGYLSSSDVPLRCRWTFDSGSHWEQIRFTVNDLQLGSDCQNEYLDIRDKPMGRHGMHHRACGSVIPPPFYSRNRQATVIYHKDTTSSLGFTLSYQKTNCHRTYTGSAGRITTPLFPANYAHHLTCTSHVIAPEGTFLSFYFEVFRLEGGWSGSCPYDYVQISNVNYDSGRLCGHNPPPPIFLSGNNATYRIESDGSVAYTGFAMTYVASTTGPGCGGNLSHAIPGMIASPEYPGAPAGPLECNWYLSSPSMLLLNFTFVGTPGSDSSSCDDSYVQVVRQDGSSYGRFCSLNDPRQIRLETATIKYVVTPSANATIFKLKFTYFDEGTF